LADTVYMKSIKRIFAYLLLPIFMFGGGFAVGSFAMDYFYPGRNFKTDDMITQILTDERINNEWLKDDWSVSAEAVDLDILEDDSEVFADNDDTDIGEGSYTVDDDSLNVMEVSLLGSSSINADTIYVIQEYSRNTRDLTEEIIPVPDNFVGMNQELFSKAMADFDRYPTLLEMQKGFISCEVISFSPNRVVIRKTYDDLTEEMKPGYYLVNDNDIVAVYLSDLKTIFMNTSISIHDLSEELKQDILSLKFVESDEELFGFLEAYSS